MADGSIRVNTKLDTKETEVDLKKLEKECEKTAKKIEEAGKKTKTVFTDASKGQLTSAFKTANRELGKTEKELAVIDAKIKEIEAETDKMLPQAATDDQAAALVQMEEQQTAPLVAKREELVAKAEEYKRQMEAITAELNKQAQAEEAQKALKAGGKTAASDAEWLGKIKNQQQYNAALQATESKMAAIEQQAERISHETGVPRQKLLEQDAEYQKLSRRQQLLIANQDKYQAEVDESTNKTRRLGNEGTRAGNKTSKAMKTACKSTNALGTAINKGIKKVSKMALAVFGIRGAFMAVRRAASAYMQDNEQLSQQMTALWNIAGQAIGPVIEIMVKGISTVVMWVSSLIKALTGVDIVAKANAAALKKQAGATKEAAKAAQLAGFDEITKLNDDSSDSGGGASAGTFDTSMVFDMPAFLEKMKQQILDGDWYGAGQTLGQALMDGIENLNWRGIGETIGDIISGAVQFAFGFITEIDPETILKGANGFLTGLFESLSKGIQNLDWKEIGKKLLDLVLAGLALANPVTAILSIMLAPGGKETTKAASKFIGSVIGALLAALVGAAQRIGELALELWDTIKTYFDGYVDWEGTPEEIIAGLWEGIKDAMKNAGKWILNNIWEPFKTGFCEAFGIASPAKKMKPYGAYIIDGIKEGIGDIWNKLKSKFSDFLAKLSEWKDTLKARAKSAGAAFTDGLKEGFNTLKNKLKDPINSVISIIEKAINWIIGKMNKLSWKVPDWVPGTGGKKWGFNISTISIPRLAKGGIVNNPGRGVLATVGEAGAEAVLPLENNTEWMDILADKINAGVQRIVVPIYLNGRKIAEEVIDLTKKRNFATNGGTL